MTLTAQITGWLKNCKILVVLGIGNPMRGDDAVGIEIVKLLKGKVPKNVKLLECQTVPENFIGELKRFNPSHVLMIDAAHFEANPGEARLIPPEKISGVTISTHAIPLYVLAGILQETVNAKVLLLGVQPKTTEFGAEMTEELREAAENIAKALMSVFKAVN